MKKEVIFEVESNEKIAADVFDLRLLGDTGAITAAGQFVEIALDGFFLRRPISVCDFSEGALRLIYKVVGKGTDFMSSLKKGAKLKALTGLGNGFSLEKCEKTALLAGGGVGVPPLLLLAKKLVESGRTVYAALGFNSAADVILADELKAIVEKRPYLNLQEWSAAYVDADPEQIGLPGSPTKVKAIENVVFTAKESRAIENNDEQLEDLIKELIANHTIG